MNMKRIDIVGDELKESDIYDFPVTSLLLTNGLDIFSKISKIADVVIIVDSAGIKWDDSLIYSLYKQDVSSKVSNLYEDEIKNIVGRPTLNMSFKSNRYIFFGKN